MHAPAGARRARLACRCRSAAPAPCLAHTGRTAAHASSRRTLGCSADGSARPCSPPHTLSETIPHLRPPLARAAAAAELARPRKLLQWVGTGWGRANQQIAAAQVSRVTTQQAIRSAVNNPFPTQQFGATQAATATGQIGTTLATTNPCSLAWTANCWGGWGWGWGAPLWGRRR